MGPATNTRRGFFGNGEISTPLVTVFFQVIADDFFLFFKPRTFAFDLSSQLSKSNPRVLSTSSSDATACEDHFFDSKHKKTK